MNPSGPASASRVKTVVEIGHGSRPIWTTLKKMPLHDQMYVGLDIDSDVWPTTFSFTGVKYRLDEGRRKIDERRAEGRSCFWLKIGSLGNLPLREASVDELYAVCVLSDPRISPLVVERLLESITLSLRPGGRFVVDNSSSREHLGPGDVMVDFERGMPIFRTASGPLLDEELSCRETLLLNTAFSPLPAEGYADFLNLRGLKERDDPEPGSRYSILIRR